MHFDTRLKYAIGMEISMNAGTSVCHILLTCRPPVTVSNVL